MSEIALSGLVGANAVAAAEPQGLQAGYGVSLTDLSSFNQSLEAGEARLEPQYSVSAPSETARAVFKPLEYINSEAVQISRFAEATAAAGNELTPGEMVILTVRCHEFLFHCQLTSNIANRTSDGLQQLFRQQS